MEKTPRMKKWRNMEKPKPSSRLRNPWPDFFAPTKEANLESREFFLCDHKIRTQKEVFSFFPRPV